MRIVLGCVLTILMLRFAGDAISQEDDELILLPSEFNYTGILQWSSDERFLAFSTQGTGWGLLDLETLEITWHDGYALNPDLSDEERERFDTSEIISVSPDGQLLLFTVPLEGHTRSADTPFEYEQFALANRTTGEIRALGWLTVPMIEETLQTIIITWSLDSHALIINSPDEENERYGYYISIPDTNTLETVETTQFGAEIDDGFYYLQDSVRHGITHLDATNNRALVVAAKYDLSVSLYEQQTYLIEWHPRQASRILLGGEETPYTGLGGIRFSPSSVDEITYWSRSPEAPMGGFFSYNVVTHVEILVWSPPIDGGIRAGSPNGIWGIFLGTTEGGMTAPYLFKFHDLFTQMPREETD